ncbi:hypothetical protein LLEC1_00690 [Akanthomyces lecanii]|uniref:Uncharacterized protein n=1 Tax=Cordyceps confragosa TaxID=2714763 RepID=A0A179ILP1_CORDF|nr:hypothetical protein LLEC1_00690 [Akanthomyces lecanii]
MINCMTQSRVEIKKKKKRITTTSVPLSSSILCSARRRQLHDPPVAGFGKESNSFPGSQTFSPDCHPHYHFRRFSNFHSQLNPIGYGSAMRTSLSCDNCRASTRERRHASDAADQTWTVRKRTWQIGGSATPSKDRTEESDSAPTHSSSRSGLSVSRDQEPEPSIGLVPLTNTYNGDAVGSYVCNLLAGIVMKCLNVFTNRFPELAMLHLPSFISELRSRSSKEVVALLSLVCVLTTSWGQHLLQREDYALYAKDLLKDLILQHPNVQVV